jgi:vitamin B12 transporter
MEPEPESFDLYFEEGPGVIAASRYPKSLSRIAENVTVINSAEIEDANVHTLAELLDRVAGVFVSFNGHDFGSSATLPIHGDSSYHNHHTLVLLDGIKLNYNSSGTAETNSIPIGIIDRVEVVKGPASSAWGSALGGVINIITKEAPISGRSRSSAHLSYGEADSYDLRAEIGGGTDRAGYYLYGGAMASDGLRDERYFENQSFYGKLRYEFADVKLRLTGGYVAPDSKLLDMPAMELSITNESEDWFTTVGLGIDLSPELTLSVSASYFDRDILQKWTVLVTGALGTAGDIFQDSEGQERSYGLEARLVRTGERHTVAAGIDYNRNELDQRKINGLFAQTVGVPPDFEPLPPEAIATPASEEKLAVYLNDTVTYGALTVIPGLRYDYHSISDDFISPSLGLVYHSRPNSIFRASVARGFSAPLLANIDGGGNLFSTPNPDLAPEKVWSYQLGAELTGFGWLRLKTTLFYHDLEGIWERNALRQMINVGDDERYGYEIELETLPFHNLALAANLTSIYQKTETLDGFDEDRLYNGNIILTFARPDLFRVELAGHYVHFLDRELINGRCSDFLWDLDISKRFTLESGRRAKIFAKAHNLFNGSQYWWDMIPNPDRWFEAGLSVSF